MPEIGRPITPQEQQYRQVTMGPRQLGNQNAGRAPTDEELINRATGQKPKSIYNGDAGRHNQMGKDEFLKLLTYQLQNQDPMNPMDQSKMTGELAQFSQLEQLSNLNTKFDQVQKNQGVQEKFYAASFVGKQVVTSGSSMKLNQEGDNADVLFKLDGEAGKVMIRIIDDKNQIVGEMWKEGMSAGSHSVTWNGVTLDGQLAAPGTYKAQVKAWGPTGLDVPAHTQATGLVTNVTFDGGEPVLTVSGQKVYLRDVASFQVAGHGAPVQNMPTAQGQQAGLRLNQAAPSPSAQQAANAYKGEEKGIYD